MKWSCDDLRGGSDQESRTPTAMSHRRRCTRLFGLNYYYSGPLLLLSWSSGNVSCVNADQSLPLRFLFWTFAPVRDPGRRSRVLVSIGCAPPCILSLTSVPSISLTLRKNELVPPFSVCDVVNWYSASHRLHLQPGL